LIAGIFLLLFKAVDTFISQLNFQSKSDGVYHPGKCVCKSKIGVLDHIELLSIAWA
jgi:hypothetical protein